MASISTTVADPSQGEGPSPPHRPVEELMNWFSSELDSFLSTNNPCASLVVPTQVGNAEGPEPAHANDHQGQPEGITTLATVIIPFSGRAISTTVILSLVPLHLVAGQYPPTLNPSLPPASLNQGSELSPFFPSHPPQPSHLSVGYPMTRNDTTIDPRYLEYAPTSGGFQIAPQNTIPEVRCDYQLPGYGDPIQEPIPESGIPAVTALPGVAVYMSPFNQTFGAYPVSGQRDTLSSTPVHRGDIPPACTAYQSEGNGQSTSRQLGQSYQDTPEFFYSAGPVRDAGGDQLEHPSRQSYRCRECDASYARLSGLNRHYKDKHTAWMACRHCNSKFSLGRKYKFTEHLQTCPGT
ncbi:hypothetical protein EDB84DRAFT_887293 [Lactarius hengduanensis]|nr:hypothetical protein EDB84DRAFT_887293 [Lactarius hengduanensis]